MIKFDNQSKITEVKKQSSNKKKEAQVQQSHRGSAMRPHVVDAKVYKVKSAFVKKNKSEMADIQQMILHLDPPLHT